MARFQGEFPVLVALDYRVVDVAVRGAGLVLVKCVDASKNGSACGESGIVGAL